MRFRFLHGDPVDRVWLFYVGVGATGVGLLSIPSSGPPIALIPMFIAAAVAMVVAAVGCHLRLAVVGLAWTATASWARALAVWGLGQHGAGSSILATFVWLWISVGALMLSAAVGRRGME